MKIFWKKKSRQISVEQLYGLFKRYFEGNASDREREVIETWLPEEERKVNLLSTDEIIEKDRIQIYRELSKRFGFESKEPIDAPVVKSKAKTVQLSPVFQAAAAASILIIIGLSSWFYYRTHSAQSIHPKSLIATTFNTLPEDGEFHLQDGSRIKMNAESNLYYKEEEFNRQKRELWFEGEAFFDVAKNQDKAFFVHSNNMKVVVHGTSFIIKAYPELDTYSVSLKSGKVEVVSDDKSIAVLIPGQQLVYHKKSGQYEINTIHWEDVSVWMDGTLAFNNAPRDELKLRLQQNYGVTIMYHEDVLRNVKLNARFPKKSSLTDVLDNISRLYDLSYRVNGKEVFLYPSE